VARSGDQIRLDVAGRRIDLLVDDDELARRQAQLAAPHRPEWARRGYAHLFHDTVLQAGEGCDFDFMGRSPAD
jgi:dihydroxy-acid dehydratase